VLNVIAPRLVAILTLVKCAPDHTPERSKNVWPGQGELRCYLNPIVRSRAFANPYGIRSGSRATYKNLAGKGRCV
jgi:hypothetical protein